MYNKANILTNYLNNIVYFFTVLKSSRKNIHKGQLLKTQVESKGISVTKLVEKAGFSRSSYYNHIKDPDLSIDILLQYDKILGVNFIDFLEEYIDRDVNDIQYIYLNSSKPVTLDESKLQTQFWKNKYLELLEKYQVLLELQLKQK